MSNFVFVPEYLTPGAQLPVGDFATWHQLETDLAAHLDPAHSQAAWSARIAMDKIYSRSLAAQDYAGVVVTDIVLQTAPHAREDLDWAIREGWQAPPDIRSELLRRFPGESPDLVGFGVTATVAREGKSDKGRLTSQIWYAPVLTEDGIKRDKRAEGIVRLATAPRVAGLKPIKRTGVGYGGSQGSSGRRTKQSGAHHY